MTHIAFETKLRSVVKSQMHPCPGNCVATERAVVNDAQQPAHLVQELNAGTVMWPGGLSQHALSDRHV